MSEPIDIRKLADFRATALVKSTSSTGKGLFVLGLVALSGWAIWVTYIRPHTKFAVKTQTQTITIERGATAIIQQKTEAPKRRLIPFMEVGMGQARNERLNTFIKIGIRVEF